MRKNTPLILSTLLHVIVISISYYGIKNPFSSEDAIKDNGYVVYDFVQIGPKSKAPILSDVEGRVSKTKSQTKEKETVSAKNQPEESSAPKKEQNNNENSKKDDTQKKDEPKQKETKTTEKKIEEKKDDDNAIALKKDKNKPKKDKTKKESNNKKNQKSNDKNKVKNNSKASEKAIVNLRKNKKNAKKSDPKSAKKSFDSLLDDAIASSDNENSGIKAEELGDVLTTTQIDLIRQTIRKCWHFPAGLKNAEELIVDIKMELSEDGSVKKAEIVDEARMRTDPNFKIAAENVHRAVLDPECNPLPLPPEKYNEWKELELSFNPKDMFD